MINNNPHNNKDPEELLSIPYIKKKYEFGMYVSI